MIVNRTGFEQFVGFFQGFGGIAVIQGITQLQFHQTGEGRINLSSRGNIFARGFIITTAQSAFGQQQVTRQLLLGRQVLNFLQIAVAQFDIVHLVGCVCRQHQGQSAVVARFFIRQHLSGLLLGLLKLAFKESQTGGTQIMGGFTSFARRAKAVHAAGHVQNARQQAYQQIQQHHQYQQTDHKRNQVDAYHGLLGHHIHITTVHTGANRQSGGYGKQDNRPNQAFHALSPFTPAGAAGLAGC